ncbi:MAG TPA: TolC family protein [Candidatus Limnocylindrales bacterium]|nr:TolC family protein [Candidatus Limnocylindrales bacterium]
MKYRVNRLLIYIGVTTVFLFIPTEGGNSSITVRDQLRAKAILVNYLQNPASFPPPGSEIPQSLILAATQETPANPSPADTSQGAESTPSTQNPSPTPSTDQVPGSNPPIPPPESSPTPTPIPLSPKKSQVTPSRPGSRTKKSKASTTSQPAPSTESPQAPATTQPAPSTGSSQVPATTQPVPSPGASQTPAVTQPAPSTGSSQAPATTQPVPSTRKPQAPAPAAGKPQAPITPSPTPSTRRPQTPATTTGKPQVPATTQPAPSTGTPQAPTTTPSPTTQQPSPPSAKPGEELPKVFLSLEEAINLALVNNFDIAIERFNPKINNERITVAEAKFDPTVVANGSASKSLTPAASQTTGSEEETRNFNAGIQQTLSPGTSYSFAFNNSWRQTNSPLAIINPAYGSNGLLTVTQPLLRGFGTAVNKAPIYIARNNRDISVSVLEGRVIQVITDVQNAYWDLVFAIGDLDAKRLALKLAQDLIRINRAQVEVGTLAPIEVLQAEASAAAREEGVLVAEETLRDTEDNLKRILNLQAGDRKFWDVSIVPLDKPPFEIRDVSVEESIKIALQKRPELVQARINLKNRNIDVLTNRNQILPALNFQGALGLNGLGASYGDNLNELTSGDFYTWQAGINFEFPLGNRAAKSNYAVAKLAAEQAEVTIKNLEQQIILDVRQAVRQIRTNIKRVESTRIARELAEKQLDAEQKKFNEGLSTNFNVLQFQSDLATAVSNEVRAITDYNKSLANLQRAMGTTLEAKNIKVQ